VCQHVGSITFVGLVIRWEYHVENFFGTVRLGCMQILLALMARPTRARGANSFHSAGMVSSCT
jgi:hypothetical protein